MNNKLQFPFLSHLFPIQTPGFIARRKTPSHCDQTWGIFRKLIAKSAAETLMLLLSALRAVRWVMLILGFFNLAVIVLVVVFMVTVFSGRCSGGELLPFVVVALVAVIKVMSMIGTGIAQEATATIIASQQQAGSSVVDAVIRHQRRSPGVWFKLQTTCHWLEEYYPKTENTIAGVMVKIEAKDRIQMKEETKQRAKYTLEPGDTYWG
ncbi:hypothetical protein ACLOJK_011967 [Asimina triloba]